MNRVTTRELARRFRDQYGVVSRSQLYAIGVSRAVTGRRLASGEWEAVCSSVIRLAGSTPTPEQGVVTLCLAAGPAAMASHRSAAWLWKLSGAPEHAAITVPRSLSGRTLSGLGGEVHRPMDWPSHVVTVRLIPCTDPLRTIVDMAGVTTPDDLEGVLDRALSARLVTPAAVDAELTRVGKRGKPGTHSLRSALNWRAGAPSRQPSVLESMTLRLLLRAGIKPLAIEVRAGPISATGWM